MSPLEQAKQIKDDFLKPRLQQMLESGLTIDKIGSPEIQAVIKPKVVEHLVAQMGPGSQYNLGQEELGEIIRSMGYEDVAFAPLPERRTSIEEAAAQIAEIESQKRNRNDDLQQRIRSAGAREVFINVGPNAASELPSRVGAAVAAIEGLPSYDPRAKENPDVYAKALRYNIPGYDLPGVSTMVDKGVPHWIADIVSETVLDPVTWADPGLMDLGKTVGLGVTVGAGAFASKVGWSIFKRGAAQSSDDLVEAMVRTTERFADVAAPARKPLFDAADITAMADEEEALLTGLDRMRMRIRDKAAAEAEAAGTTPARETQIQFKSEWLRKFSDTLIKKRGGTAEGRLDADKTLVGWIKQLYNEDLPGGREIASELLELRTAMVDSPDELRRFQTHVTQRLGKILDQDAVDAIRRTDIVENFVDVRTGEIRAVEAGLVSQFRENPQDFLRVKKNGELAWKSDKRSRALRLFLNDQDPAVATDYFGSLVPIGQTKLFRETAAAIATTQTLESLADRIPEHLGPLRWAFKQMGPMNERLAKTPIFRPMVMAYNARNAEKMMYNMRFHKMLGAEIGHVGDGFLELITTGGTGYKIRNRSLLLPKDRSLFSLARLLDKRKSGKAADLNDAIIWAFGDEALNQAIRNKRAVRGVKAVPEVTDEARKYARNVQILFDEMGQEAIKLGIVDPRTLLKNYLPRIWRKMRTGVSATDAIDLIRNNDGPRAAEAEPFFALIRQGEDPENLMTDLPRMFELYVDTLTKHKYVKPFINDALKVLGSSTYDMAPEDRMFALDYLHHLMGGQSTLEAALNQRMRSMASNINELVRDTGQMAELVDDRLAALGRDLEREGRAHWFSRQLTDLWYTHFLGLKLGPAFRNYGTLPLAVPAIGGMTEGPMRLARGLSRLKGSKGLFAKYMESARRYDWHSEFFEFADASFDELAPFAPDILPKGYKKALMSFFQLSEMHIRAASWAGGYDYAESIVKQVANGKKAKNWLNSARQFTAEEQASLKRLLDEGAYEQFKTVYAEAVVNNSFWLYNRRNRPKWAQSNNPVLGAMMVFMTWPMNYASVYARASTKSALLKNKGNMEFYQNAFNNGLRWLAPMVGVGLGLEYVGRETGIGGMGDWFFPSKKQGEAKVIYPFPPGKALEPFIEGANPTTPPSETLPVLGLWAALHNIGVNAFDKAMNPDEVDLRARNFDSLFQAIPVLPQGAHPLWQQLGRELGLEPDPDYREGIFEQVLAAMLGMRESEGTGEDIRRGTSMPKAPGEEDRAVFPFEQPD